ncbi:MAG: pyridoxamine 5'-phosphate oxidase [Deltaproteobacteria bacterium]|nr:pyridoxamine 5'-phosphate oxidase [Deltaproteobacteria bacterium]
MQRTMSDSPDLAHAGRARTAAEPARVDAAFAQHREDPLARFLNLLALARSEPRQLEPTAMSLATVGDDGRPSSRIVLLKDADARGLTFFTNLDSHKGRELRAHPDAALLFHWQALELQIRFEGRATQVPDAEADAYFATRPRASQLGAWASAQSHELSSREALMQALQDATQRFQGQDVPRPPRWGGFRLVPALIEFWRADPARLHQREEYRREAIDARWTMRLLNP